MSDVDTPESNTKEEWAIPRKIVIARHVVGISLLLLIPSYSFMHHGVPGDYWLIWLIANGLIFVTSGILFGLFWLFFTKHIKSHEFLVFIAISWTLVVLVTLGQATYLFDGSGQDQHSERAVKQNSSGFNYDEKGNLISQSKKGK